jgi:hypothetical protein
MPLSLMHFVLVIFTRNFKSMIDGDISWNGKIKMWKSSFMYNFKMNDQYIDKS